ncbi:MAG: FAD binding domain-containing protein [Firmicutes bacterium]|nr:FAD binding domain-containing protein [Bacillota bacterium]
MIPRIDYDRPAALDTVLDVLLREGRRARPLAGGTDLLQLLKDGLLEVEHLLDLRALAPTLSGIAVGPGGALRIGALTTLAEVAEHPLVRGSFRALAQAAQLSASPQLRNMATIGGNLLQLNRCEYFRSDLPCWLHGGRSCLAAEGDHRHHAIFPQAPCLAVHPSDPATALLAFDARVEIARPGGAVVEEPLSARLKDPDPDDPHHFHLEEGELITAVLLPPAEGESVYEKAMERAAWSFALAAAAVRLSFSDGGRVAAARVVLGGVAGRPRRAEAAEAALLGRPLDAEAVAAAVEAALEGAAPLPGNAYKVELAKGILRKALQRLSPQAG